MVMIRELIDVEGRLQEGGGRRTDARVGDARVGDELLG
jgi:hypothetical protein